MKLSEFYGEGAERDRSDPNDSWFDTCRPSNIDDLFRSLRKRNIKEIEVTAEEMFSIAQFAIANAQGLYDSPYTSNQVLEIVKSGKIDRFFGVALTMV